MTGESSDEGDAETKSTRTRWRFTGSTAAFLLVFTLCGVVAYFAAVDRTVPLWVATTFSLAVLTACAWTFGSGALKAAKDAVGGQQ